MYRLLAIFLLISLSLAKDLTVMVSHYTPSRYSSRDNTLLWRLHFSEPMRETGADPGSSIPTMSIKPDIEGVWQWTSNKSLTFTANLVDSTPMQHTLTIHKGATALSGNKLRKEIVDHLRMADFRVYASGDTTLSRESPIPLHATLPVDTTKLRQAISGISVDYRIEQDRYQTTLHPDPLWPEEPFTLTIDNSLTPQKGNLTLRAAYRKTFTVNDTLSITGFYHIKDPYGKEMLPIDHRDSLYLEKAYYLYFSHTLSPHMDSFVTINGKPFHNYGSKTINVTDLVHPDHPCTVQIKAGLPSTNGACFFRDTTLIFKGDSNRIDPDLPSLSIDSVMVGEQHRLSEHTPLPLKRYYKLRFACAGVARDYNTMFSPSQVTIHTPDTILRWEKDTVRNFYAYPPVTLPPNTLCTLVVQKGTRSRREIKRGNHESYQQLKEVYRLPFRTGAAAFDAQLSFYRKATEWESRARKNYVDQITTRILPLQPTVPLEQYGKGTAVEIRPVGTKERLLVERDSLLQGTWIRGDLSHFPPDSTKNYFLPLLVDSVLTPKGYGAFDARIIGKKDTVRLHRMLVSDLAVQSNSSRQGYEVTVTSLLNRGPVAHAGLILYDSSGAELLRSRTDSMGICKLISQKKLEELHDKKKFSPYRNHLLVYKGEDSLLINASIRKPQTLIQGVIRTERPLYKPGEMLYFSGVVRKMEEHWEAADFQMVALSIGWHGSTPYTDTVPLSGVGFFADSIRIPADVSHRTYSLEATLLTTGQTMSTSFSVEEYHPRELKAALHQQVTRSVTKGSTSDSLYFDLSASWLHGGKASGASFTWKSTTGANAGINLPRDYWWDLAYSPSIPHLHGSGILDNSGKATIGIPKKGIASGSTLSVEARVTGSPTQEESVSSYWRAPNGKDIRLGIGIWAKTRADFNQDTTTRPIGMVLCEDNSVPSAQNIELLITRERARKEWTKNRFGLPALLIDTLTDTVYHKTLLSDDSGYVFSPIAQYDPGTYSCRLTCSSAVNTVQEWTYTIHSTEHTEKREKGEIDTTDTTRQWSLEPVDSSFIPTPGDSIAFLITTAKDSSTLLLQLERERVFYRQWLTIAGSDTIITLPIDERAVPEVRVTALFLPPLAKGKKTLEHRQPTPYATARHTITVSAAHREIPVTVKTARKSYAPGDTAKIRLQIPQKFTGANATISVIDNAVLRLRNSSGNGHFYHFYQKPLPYHWLSTNEYFGRILYGPVDYDSLNSTIEAPQCHLSFSGFRGQGFGGGCGGLGGLAGSDVGGICNFQSISTIVNRPQRGEPAQLFETLQLRLPKRTTALFTARVAFDSLGTATVTCPLPGNLTQWVVKATVDGVQSFGAGSTTFSTSKPLMVRPQMPHFLRMGDSASGAFLVENRGGSTDSILAGSVWNGDTMLQDLILAPDEITLCRAPMVATQTDTTHLIIGAKSTTTQDGLSLKIPIITERVRQVSAFGGSTEDSLRIPFVQPEQAIDSGSLSLKVSTTRMEQLDEALRYLFTYPYGCLEQRASKVMPLIELADFSDRFDLKLLEKGDEDKVIMDFLDQIPSFTKGSGGFGYWPRSNGRASRWLTLYLLDLMNKAAAQGYPIDADAYEKAIDYVLKREHTDSLSSYGAYIESYTQRVLAEAGRADKATLKKLYTMREELPLDGKIHLLKAHFAAGSSKRIIKKLQKELTGDIVESGRLAYFAPVEEKWFWRCHISTVRTTALALEALLTTGARSEYDEPMIRWLSEQRRNGRWRTTQENMAVFRAFNAYTKVYEKDDPALSVAASLSGSLWFTDSLFGRQASITKRKSSLPESGKGDTLALKRTGTGRLYADLLLTRYPAGLCTPNGRGFTIKRELYPLSGNTTTPVEPAELQAGEKYTVTLTIIGAQDNSFVAINDPIPAGCSAINPEHKGANQKLAEQHTHWNSSSTLSYTEFRKERVLLFADDLRAGQTTYSYIIKAVTPGRFSWPAPQVEAMYYPEFFAHGSERVVHITNSNK